jgi:hypothetical protein
VEKLGSESLSLGSRIYVAFAPHSVAASVIGVATCGHRMGAQDAANAQSWSALV